MVVGTASDAITPESRVIVRICTFSRASARTSARHTASYGASICSVYAAGRTGATYARLQPASATRASPPARPRRPPNGLISSALVVVDAAVRLDEAHH